MEDLKHTFSIQLPIGLYKKIVNEAGRGKVSTFIREILEEKLSESEDRLSQEYRECYSNPRMIKEAQQWEKAGIESWLNYEKNKDDKPVKVKWSKKVTNGRKDN